MTNIASRIEHFCQTHSLRIPILLAPMAGASPPSLSIGVMRAGGLGACGALLMKSAEILAWVQDVRAQTPGPFQINLWIPDPPPVRDSHHEARVRAFLAQWGPSVPADAGDARPPEFALQCQTLLDAAPPIVSSVMGLYPPEFVAQLRARGIRWFANVTTVREAKSAEAAGADAIVAQGAEAGGHRGCFDPQDAHRELVGLFALLPAVVDGVRLPVVATGGIADARTIAAAFLLGATAVQIGTGFLRCPEARLHPAWANGLAHAAPEETIVSSVFSGRPGRSLATTYVRAATAPEAPTPAPYPVQRGLTGPMRTTASQTGDLERMQAWAGQSAALARAQPVQSLVTDLWNNSRASFLCSPNGIADERGQMTKSESQYTAIISPAN